MAKIVKAELPKDASLRGNITIENIDLIGINYTGEIVNLFWIFETDENNHILIRNSYLADESDFNYFNSIYFKRININTADEDHANLIKKTISSFNISNSYYSDFNPFDIIDGTAFINFIQKDINDKTNYKIAKIPFSIYMNLATIKNNICCNFAFNSYSVRESSYVNYKIHNSVELNYLGSESLTPIICNNFYSISYDDKKVGIYATYLAERPIILSKLYKGSSFGVFYNDNFAYDDPTIMVPMMWKINSDDKNPELYISLIKRNTKDIFILTQKQYFQILDPFEDNTNDSVKLTEDINNGK